MKYKIFLFTVLFFFNFINAQNDSLQKQPSIFWSKVKFGGGLNLAFGNGNANIGISPAMVYPINKIVDLGIGLNYNYIKVNGWYQSNVYGGSIMSFFNVHENIQLSSEFEPNLVNLNSTNSTIKSENFWNNALFLGGGYRNQNFIIGLRYNVLFKENDFVYAQALVPFVRIWF